MMARSGSAAGATGGIGRFPRTGRRSGGAPWPASVRRAALLLTCGSIACGPADSSSASSGEGGGGRDAPVATPARVAGLVPPPRHVLAVDSARASTKGLDSVALAAALAAADSLPGLRCLLIARHGEVHAERCRSGFDPDRPANVKSVSKSVLSALVGVAIRDGLLEGPDQPVLPFFEEQLHSAPDPRKGLITVGHLLSMQSGLQRTSGRNYGAWVRSPDWVADAIGRPMVAEPGGRMLYSTGNYHLLAALLTRASGRSLLDYARTELASPLGIRLPPWPRDPQGIYFGGNDMRLSPRAMVRFGELYRNEGRHGGRQVAPRAWVWTSLEPRTRSPWSGERYGYGWFLGRAGDHPMFYAWGYGGQFIFVVPDLALTVVTTSDPAAPRGGDHLRRVHRLLDRWIVQAAERGAGATPPDGTDATSPAPAPPAAGPGVGRRSPPR